MTSKVVCRWWKSLLCIRSEIQSRRIQIDLAKMTPWGLSKRTKNSTQDPRLQMADVGVQDTRVHSCKETVVERVEMVLCFEHGAWSYGWRLERLEVLEDALNRAGTAGSCRRRQ